jgi:hypothetical protein
MASDWTPLNLWGVTVSVPSPGRPSGLLWLFNGKKLEALAAGRAVIQTRVTVSR